MIDNLVVHGDCLEYLNTLDDESIDLTFTSPPYYNARDYSTYENYNQYLDFLDTIFSAIHTVTKEGRFLVINVSPVIVPRAKRSESSKRHAIPFDIHSRLLKIGWEFIDDIIWLKPESSVKARNNGFLQHRKPLGYKPNAVTEYVLVYRKQTDKLIDWNMKQYDQSTISASRILGNFQSSNVWRIAPARDKVHSAVFPVELANLVIRYYSFKGDIIFDPFGGSGTVAISACNLSRRFILCEQHAHYVKRIEKRLFNEVDDKSIAFSFYNMSDGSIATSPLQNRLL